MITKDCIETAYCFFHQKWRVYSMSHNETQKEDIEYAIRSYVENMDKSLYAEISDGNADFLMSHKSFVWDMPQAIERLERMMME